MRPVQLSPEALRQQLALQPAQAAPELAAVLGVSVPTLHRQMARLPAGEVISAGRARRTRHALARRLRGGPSQLPVFAVGREGRLQAVGPLTLTQPEGSHLLLADAGWPVPEEARDGWWPGLPYPLHQMRPQGYMGRQFARLSHRRLQVPEDVTRWSDDDALFVMSVAGSDLSGNLIVGEAACQQWLAERAQPQAPMAEAEHVAHYLQRADEAVATGVAGSSAAGEFPKFTAARALAGAATPHVIVKFSGADDSTTVRRWADLLVCEHLALEAAATLPGLRAARSRILAGGGRTFLEVERFDRHGDAGRSALCALDVLDAAFLGRGGSQWPALTAALDGLGLLAEGVAPAVQRLWWFGRLIANSDMHTGNLAFAPHEGRLTLAPAYDMLPMRLAPLAGGELPVRTPEFALPLPAERTAWHEACTAALGFWEAAAADPRISEGFRALCGEHAQALRPLAERA